MDERPLDEYVDWDDLLEGRRELAVSYLGRDVRFTYDPNRYTGSLQAKLERAFALPVGDPRRAELFDQLLLTLLTWWNFRRREGGEVGIDANTLAKLALPLRITMSMAIQRDLGLTEGPKGESGTDSRAPSQNGQAELSPVGGVPSEHHEATG